MAKGVPWAPNEERLKPEELLSQKSRRYVEKDLYGQMARMAIEWGVSAATAPMHFLRKGAGNHWLPVD